MFYNSLIMNKNKVIGIALIIAAVFLAIFSFIVLPEDVVVQFNISGNANKIGKIPAILIPSFITIFFSSMFIGNGERDERNKKNLLGALLGLIIFFVMIGVNL